ncbi:MAG: Sec-independent protein translocase subunit TatA/TatB [Acidiferrobacter sp.]
MFDFSFPELLIIGIVAVLVLDPRHLPDLARSAGRWMGRARRLMDKVREDLDSHIGTEHMAPLRELNQEWQRTKSLLSERVIPQEWQDSVGDNSADRAPPAIAPPGARRALPDGHPPKRRRRRRPRGSRHHPAAAVRAATVRKPDGGGEGA